jgi:uncharacterized paraquat-inducible protein A
MKSEIARVVATLGIWVTGSAVAITALIAMMFGTRIVWQNPRLLNATDTDPKRKSQNPSDAE